mmetsp:Transcript_20290/g.28090  ORF Transcript_20290/g.28090 Transcript_20290/m.28090 type:complete len:305 (+) Transcript_20290:159-1073(+)|eukprot:CAMPEP_0196572676 /NCGR_PEP_ID=MMETSP1081-20130531/2671_1 /TAXON_ID=36882 /ORGANISM="Pyramimonas amylifera, Strain CCMP720" /LENGTH=304 /DNA_ID=CAMNT_0041890065 /DNA_START=155 /DNA_END=1069 /DNA_ORIENTATION=+
MGDEPEPLENALYRCGQFSVPGHTTIGDPYITGGAKMKMDRYNGKQFGVPGIVWGKNPDAMIDKEFKSLSENDVYLDPGALERKHRTTRGGKNISEKAFLPSSPSKNASGKGTNFGLFQKFDNLPTENEENPRKSGPGPKNFLNSKPMKGSYGMTGHFLGATPEFVADTYLNSREIEKESRRAARDKIGKAFVCTGRSQGLFDKNPYEQDAGPQYRKKTRQPLEGKPFKTPGPCKSGANNTFSSAEYVEDPIAEKEALDRAEKAAARPKGPAFKSANCLHTPYTTDVNPFVMAERAKPAVDILY